MPALLERLAKLAERAGSSASIIEEALRRLNGSPGDTASFDRLHAAAGGAGVPAGVLASLGRGDQLPPLLRHQRPGRPAHGKSAGLCRDPPADPQAAGRRAWSSGLRIDHPDGLLNPMQYFARLQMLYAASHCLRRRKPTQPPATTESSWMCKRPSASTTSPSSNGAALPAGGEDPGAAASTCREWPVDGTVGYDFANLVNGILSISRNERYFTNLYHRVIGDSVGSGHASSTRARSWSCARRWPAKSMCSPTCSTEISMQDRRARDFTRSVLRDAIRETIACFPVYRTYIDERGNISETRPPLHRAGHRRWPSGAIATSRRRHSTSCRTFCC